MSSQPLNPWGSQQWGINNTWGAGAPETLPASYYLNLYTSEYRLATNLLAFTSLLIQPQQDINQCLLSFLSVFDLSAAVGAQLDILGAIVGASRTVLFQPSNNVSPVLDDATYRILIQAQIANNQWDGKLSSLQAIFRSIFPNGSIAVVDGFNMTATVILAGGFSSIIIDLIEHDMIIPRSQAVLYTFAFGTTPYFGFGEEDSFIAGFGTGYFVA